MTHPDITRPDGAAAVAVESARGALPTAIERFEAKALAHVAKRHAGKESTYLRGLSDASVLCDLICFAIEREHTVRGRVTREGRALSAAVSRASDAIWSLLGRVNVTPKSAT